MTEQHELASCHNEELMPMCFCLHLGTVSAPPLIRFEAPRAGVWLAKLQTHAEMVRQKFSLPVVTFVGSDRGCGCGFRNELIVDSEAQTQPNHLSLVAFLKAAFPAEQFVELYGCRWGTFREPIQERREIGLTQLAARDFQFHERSLCRVQLSA